MSISLITAPWIILLAVSLYGVVHSWLASLGVKAWTRYRYGELAERIYRFAYNLFAIVTLLPVLALPALLPDRRLYSIPMPWAFVLMGLQLLAVGALGLGLLQTGVWSFLGLQQLAGRREIGADDQLVVSGLYRCHDPQFTQPVCRIKYLPGGGSDLRRAQTAGSLWGSLCSLP
jgi:hypothetical protein